MRLRLGTTIAIAALVGGALAGSSAGAHPSAIRALRGHTARPQRSYVSKFPWGSAPARVVPRQLVVVWKHGARPAAERALSVHLGTRRIAPTPNLGVDVVHVPRGRSMAAATRALERSPLVRSVEPNRVASIAAPPLPDDTDFSEQWALNNTGQTHTMTDQGGGTGTTTNGTSDADVDAPEAWADQTNHNPVVVAVIDTGVDINHPDLVDRLWTNPGEIDGNSIDDDHNGFVDDIHGWDFKDGDADPSPSTSGTPANKLENAHGTHVAGIVAAKQDNALGVSGVCPDC